MHPGVFKLLAGTASPASGCRRRRRRRRAAQLAPFVTPLEPRTPFLLVLARAAAPARGEHRPHLLGGLAHPAPLHLLVEQLPPVEHDGVCRFVRRGAGAHREPLLPRLAGATRPLLGQTAAKEHTAAPVRDLYALDRDGAQEEESPEAAVEDVLQVDKDRRRDDLVRERSAQKGHGSRPEENKDPCPKVL